MSLTCYVWCSQFHFQVDYHNAWSKTAHSTQRNISSRCVLPFLYIHNSLYLFLINKSLKTVHNQLHSKVSYYHDHPERLPSLPCRIQILEARYSHSQFTDDNPMLRLHTIHLFVSNWLILRDETVLQCCRPIVTTFSVNDAQLPLGKSLETSDKRALVQFLFSKKWCQQVRPQGSGRLPEQTIDWARRTLTHNI